MRPKFIIIHHTVSKRDNTSVHDVNNWHKARWNWESSMGHYMGYHFLITGDGKIHQGAKPTEERAHTIGYNDKAIGICLTGNFETEKPNERQLNSLSNLLEKLSEKYNIPKYNIRGHRELSQTLCPGENLFNWLKEWRVKHINIWKFLIKQIKLEIEKLKGRKTK